MIAMVSSSRHFQKVVFAVALLICITFWKYKQPSSISYNKGPLPQSIGTGNHHSPPPKISRGYSVKPLAYIFPQYYVSEDNNRLHGENFTEWDNVQKVTENRYGLETIRPHESIGFYDGLELATRKRYGTFLRDYGFHGAVFHHYWFDGRPVMDHVVQKMLKDGEPDIPFMLSWANEPWSRTWNGADGEVLIAQKYGLHAAWRKHFDWLLPFFRHPQYIRSEGKIQFVVYHPSHVGHLGPMMFAAWRQWAVEEGLGGMDIIETRWSEDISLDQWVGYPPDAVNEFMPHVAGTDTAKFYNTKRVSRVYHRGSMACWDTTPRHPTDSAAVAEPFCHPNTFQNHLVEMFRIIKADPNPIGAENFLFVNALNAWGEGNALEPSIQFGNGYGLAMKNAVEITAKEHVWPDIATEDKNIRDQQVSAVMNQSADVCVVVRTSRADAEDHTFNLAATLRSLQAQSNLKWRAAVVQANDTGEFRSLDQVITRHTDPRIKRFRMPESTKLFTPKNDGGWMAMDWYIGNLTMPDAFCAGAKYLLITKGNTTYEPTAFDVASRVEGDMVGLNVESKQTIWNHPELQHTSSWDSRCTPLENKTMTLFDMSIPTMEHFDLTATFINASRLMSEGHKFSTFSGAFHGHQPEALAGLLISDFSWKFFTAPSASAQVYHNPSYTGCLKTGNFWFDSPIKEEVGCYRSSEFRKRFEKEYEDQDTKYLADYDLQFFRDHGYCVRYKKEAYENARARPPPAPPRPWHEPVKFQETNPDLFEQNKEAEQRKNQHVSALPGATSSSAATEATTLPESAEVINTSGGV